MKKRVLFVIPAMNIGGAEKSLIELSKVINYNQYSVDLLLLESGGVLLDKIDKRMNVLYADDYTRYLLKGFKESIKYLFQKKKIKDICKRFLLTVKNRYNKTHNIAYIMWKLFKDSIAKYTEEYDIAIAYLQGISEYYVIDKTTAGKKILWMHTSFSAHSENNYTEKQYIDKFDRIVCVSKESKNDFVDLFPSKESSTDVFYNIVNQQEINTLADSEKPVLPNKGKFNIVSVGRLHNAKGYDISISAFKKIFSENPETRFYIIGDGPEKEKLEKIITDNNLNEVCYLLGSMVNPYPYIKEADLILQASRYEGYCIVLAEAKALYKPILSTDFFGAKEQLSDGETGKIVECNSEKIAHACKELILNKSELDRFSKNLKKQQLGEQQSISELLER